MTDEAIRALRAALDVSPENVPLRKHLAGTLLRMGRLGEAEAEFRQALSLAPEDGEVKLGLAESYARLGKVSHALVIAEDLARSPDAPAGTFLLQARLLADQGDDARAASLYRRAVEMDPGIADHALAERLEVDLAPGGFGGGPEDDPLVDDEGRMRATWEGDRSSGEAGPPVERPHMGFADVGGMEALKEEIRIKIVAPLAHPELYRAYGKAIGGGVLLYGPPGCGKTHLARATAGEVHAAFLSVGINDVLDMYIGNSERNLHELFESARRNRPCVLFFDEVDALGASRSDLRHSGARHLVNQFLAEMDGVDRDNDGLLILAATNAPWHLDSAFRRPGRFDRILFVPPPDAPARASILRVMLREKPVEHIDYDQVAKKADGFSGADLKAVVDQAIEAKLREAIKVGIPKPLATKDLLAAVKEVRPSTREWFATARNYALYSNQSGLYDDILKYLKL